MPTSSAAGASSSGTADPVKQAQLYRLAARLDAALKHMPALTTSEYYRFESKLREEMVNLTFSLMSV